MKSSPAKSITTPPTRPRIPSPQNCSAAGGVKETALWQGLLTLPRSRPKVSRPARRHSVAACGTVLRPAATECLTTMELIRIENLFKTYYLGEVDVPVLKGV